VFGLVHGFGFSYGLKQNLQVRRKPSGRFPAGVQRGNRLGQLAVLAVLLPVLLLLRRSVLGDAQAFVSSRRSLLTPAGTG